MGMSPNDPNDEALWRDAAIKASEFPLTPEGVLDALTREDVSKGKSSWPILIFFAVVMGTPWLIWKLLAKISGSNDDAKNKRWMRGESDHYLACGAYDFVAQSPKEVSFSTGQQIIVAPKDSQPRVRGWLLASVDGQRSGLVPANYIKILGFRTAQLLPEAEPDISMDPNANSS
jgi:peroxin-13